MVQQWQRSERQKSLVNPHNPELRKTAMLVINDWCSTQQAFRPLFKTPSSVSFENIETVYQGEKNV